MAEKDMTEKTLEDYNDVFSDLINVLLFNGKRKVQEDMLETATARSVYKADNKLREQERDVAKYWRNINFRIAMFGLENQTDQEKDITLRLVGYDGAAYRDQLFYVKDENDKRKMNDNPRYMVVTVVLYFGMEHWSKPKTLGEALEEIPEELKPYFNDYKANIFEIAWLTDEQVEMFQSDFRIVADYFVQMRKNKNYVPSDRQITHVKEVLQLMSVLTKDNRFEEACNELEKGEEVSTMNEWLDKVENRGMRRGQISEYIKIRREDGYSEEEIESAIIKRYGLTEEQAEEYMHELATV